MNIKVYNQAGKEVGEIELPKVFALPWNADLVHQVVTSQMANRRPTVAKVKDRGEVSGGGKKPWRQKGTGRARHGSIRSPLWKGGGVTHGPTAERDFSKKINKKMAAKALATVLSAKTRDHQMLVMDAFEFPQPKTKEAAKVFANFSKIKNFSDIAKSKNRVLVLLPEKNDSTRRALRNLPFIAIEEARNITALEMLNHKYVVLPKPGIDVLTKRMTNA